MGVPEGYFRNKVVIKATGEALIDLTGDTVTAADVSEGVTFHDHTGAVLAGSVADIGALNARIDGFSVTKVTVPPGRTSGGDIVLTDDIERALSLL